MGGAGFGFSKTMAARGLVNGRGPRSGRDSVFENPNPVPDIKKTSIRYARQKGKTDFPQAQSTRNRALTLNWRNSEGQQKNTVQLQRKHTGKPYHNDDGLHHQNGHRSIQVPEYHPDSSPVPLETPLHHAQTDRRDGSSCSNGSEHQHNRYVQDGYPRNPYPQEQSRQNFLRSSCRYAHQNR